MTPRERAKEATWEAGCPDWGSDDQEQLEMAVEQAIIAAVEEDRKTRQHQFVGRNDRGCELCGEPDRDEIHICSRETYRNWLKLAVEAEREACAKIVDEARERITANNYQADVGRRFATGIAAQIRARSNASSASQAD